MSEVPLYLVEHEVEEELSVGALLRHARQHLYQTDRL